MFDLAQRNDGVKRETRRSVGIRIAITAVVMALLVVLAAACGSDSSPPTGPRLTLDGDTFDLGMIPLDKTVERAVAFRNEGVEPLTVSIVKVRPGPDADCGCGVEGFEVQPEVVQPGANGQLVFRLYTPPGMEGKRDEMLVELESDDQSDSQRTISIIFEMEAKADTEG
jgi:hypothetical protein